MDYRPRRRNRTLLSLTAATLLLPLTLLLPSAHHDQDAPPTVAGHSMVDDRQAPRAVSEMRGARHDDETGS
jgi:hypothetical protein